MRKVKSDDSILGAVTIRKAFFDRKSTEEGTVRVKQKYKLLTQKDLSLRELGVFVFHVLTTTEDSYPKDKTIDIYRSDWEFRKENRLDADYSKLCSQKVDCMNRASLLAKMRDRRNKFKHVGTLKQSKFTEVINFIKESFESVDIKTDFEVKEIINSIFNKTPISDRVIKRFGI